MSANLINILKKPRYLFPGVYILIVLLTWIFVPILTRAFPSFFVISSEMGFGFSFWLRVILNWFVMIILFSGYLVSLIFPFLRDFANSGWGFRGPESPSFFLLYLVPVFLLFCIGYILEFISHIKKSSPDQNRPR